MRRLLQVSSTLILVGAGILTTPSLAGAAFQLRLQAGSDVVVVQDNQAGDLNAAVGAITFSGPVGGNFTLNVTTGLTNPVIGNSFAAHMDLNSVNVSSTSGGSLAITLINDAVTSPTITPTPVGLTSQVGGTLTSSGSFTFQSWFNPNAAAAPTYGPNGQLLAPGGSITPGELGPYTGGPFSGSASSQFMLNQTPYSLFSQAFINFDGQGVVSFNGDTILATPVPGGLTLALCGLPFLGVAYWRRRAKKA